jgi:hypothetical protein
MKKRTCGTSPFAGCMGYFLQTRLRDEIVIADEREWRTLEASEGVVRNVIFLHHQSTATVDRFEAKCRSDN